MPKCDFNRVACNFIKITFSHRCSPVNFLHIFRTPFLKSTSGWLLLTSFESGKNFDEVIRKLLNDFLTLDKWFNKSWEISFYDS